MPSQIEDAFVGLARRPAEGPLPQWLLALRDAAEARDVVESRRVLCNLDHGGWEAFFDDSETWDRFLWQGARWCLDRDWYDDVCDCS